jgi:hypothetical protein
MKRKSPHKLTKKNSSFIESFFKETYEASKDTRSMRTIFRLSKEGADDLKWLAKTKAKTAKDIIHAISMDLSTGRILREYEKNAGREDLAMHSFFDRVLQLAIRTDVEMADRSVRKNQVISVGATNILKMISKEFGVPRDILVDSALKVLKNDTQKEIESIENYREAREVLDDCCESIIRSRFKVDELIYEPEISTGLIEMENQAYDLLELLDQKMKEIMKNTQR